MYFVFEFGPSVKFAEGIHGELVYSIVSVEVIGLLFFACWMKNGQNLIGFQESSG